MKKRLGSLFIIIGLIVFCFVLYKAGQYKKANDYYASLKAKSISADPLNTGSDDWYEIDWDSLKKENPDIVGWIRMDPDISYPIVQGKDNSFYLNHGFDKNYNINGSIFMHCDNRNDWSDRNTVVYGHNMINGAMFGMLKKYADKEYANEHRYFYIYVEKGRFKYEVASYMRVQDMTPVYTTDIHSDGQMETFLEEIKPFAAYWLKEPSIKSHVVTLSTCAGAERNLSRQVVQGTLVEYERSKDRKILDADEVHERWENRNAEENRKNLEEQISETIAGSGDTEG